MTSSLQLGRESKILGCPFIPLSCLSHTLVSLFWWRTCSSCLLLIELLWFFLRIIWKVVFRAQYQHTDWLLHHDAWWAALSQQKWNKNKTHTRTGTWALWKQNTPWPAVHSREDRRKQVLKLHQNAILQQKSMKIKKFWSENFKPLAETNSVNTWMARVERRQCCH